MGKNESKYLVKYSDNSKISLTVCIVVGNHDHATLLHVPCSLLVGAVTLKPVTVIFLKLVHKHRHAQGKSR